MRFQLNDDQRALRGGVRELLAGRFGRDRMRACVADPSVDRRLWRELGAAGVFGLRLEEMGLAEAALVFEEAGRALLPGPLVATHLSAGVVDGAAEGEAVVAGCDGALVDHLPDADAVLWLDESGAFVVDPAELVTVELRSVDPMTPLNRVTVRPAEGRALPGAARLRREAVLLTAAQQCGIAGRTLESAVEYAGVRRQFGRAIGAFQAVKHLCADMLVRVEMARTAVHAAAVTGDPVETAAAKLLADEAAVRNSRDCLQIFAGTGFTWEADVHLHMKRAWLLSTRFAREGEIQDALASSLPAPGIW
ncbi:acyl-CoA dehydrogenase family protein [Streptantibioticus rubrisoli]|uniref:Acyl-CoA dehydrogenase family protein n=1 Tax=Streptantibioticus rubrisoli TaxID=1387313 RepID=A0ABT1PAG6_9ACTN|nr:acyl-CoA dehydrogenase [Streptantibioticus rubrisoli]MCQ4042364.1 acyl-CoA dehydrogenase family protein [Streptantibioticus rubrisoli]